MLLTSVAHAQVKETEYVLDTPRDYKKYPARSATFIEIGGNGSLYSLNFDQLLVYREQFKISGRAGLAIYPNGFYIEQAYVLENNYIFFSSPHHLEIGPSVTLQRKFQTSCREPMHDIWENIWYGMFRLGYRYQKEEDGFFFRIGMLGIPYKKDDCGTHIPPQNKLWFGVSIGMSY